MTTILVFLAVAAYTAYTVATWVTRPWITTSQNLWGWNNGPWPLDVRCRAPAGCWISNRVNSRSEAIDALRHPYGALAAVNELTGSLIERTAVGLCLMMLFCMQMDRGFHAKCNSAKRLHVSAIRQLHHL